MAQLEVSIQYQSLNKNWLILLGVLWAALGVLSVKLIIILSALTGLTASGLFAFLPMQWLFVICSSALYAYVPFQMLIKYAHGNHILANKDGLGVPPALLGPPRWLPWSQLRLANVVSTYNGDRLELTFAPGGKVALKTKRMAAKDLEQLLFAIEVWGLENKWSQALSDYRDQLQNKKIGMDGIGYTQIWEEELSRRYNSTTFVPLEPGRKLRSGTLTVLRQLAFGGFSAVYLAEDHERRQVVIKESVTSSTEEIDSTQEKALEFFKREAEVLSKLQHDQIARVLDNFIEGGRTYLVLEYIPGENLREFVRRNGPQSEDLVIAWMLQMAKILEYLHCQSPPIMHRDFTPDNIVLKSDGTIVLIDFGAANQFVGNATGTLVGKQSYMPPEQVRAKAEPRSDLYALGCTAHFLLTGSDPEPLSVCHPRTLQKSVSEKTDELIAHLTQQEPEDRVESATQLVHQLNQSTTLLLNHEPIQSLIQD